jgi:AAHS family 4-hydroxybenzoate transporter-like MFS transporter
LFWTFLALLAAGYDLAVIAFAAPEMSRQWHLDPATFGPVLSASMFGVFLGAPLLGVVGDRWGRRPAIVCGCVVYGLATLMLVSVTDLQRMFWWRLIAGIGIGGLMPNAVALIAELAPKRARAALIIIMFIGIFVGNAAPSVVMACVPAAASIGALLLVGGIVPLSVALCAAFFLPESVRFLALREKYRPRLLSTLRRLRCDLRIESDAVIVSETAPVNARSGTVAQLFGPGLTVATPLLWLCFICSLMAIYFLSSWLPLMFERRGIEPADAAWITALYYIGGGVGSLVVGVLMDRFGFLVVTIFFVLSVPAISLIGLAAQSVLFIACTTVLAGFLGQSVQLALNAGTALIYPTAFRAKAVGWALAVGRPGSVAGPMIGGLAFGLKLSFGALFFIPAFPMLIGGAASAALTVILKKKSGSFRIREIVS